MRAIFCPLLILMCLVSFIRGNSADAETGRHIGGAEVRVIYRVLEECGEKNIESCLTMKAVTFMDRIMRKNKIFLNDGLSLEKSSEDMDYPAYGEEGRTLTEAELENSLPQDEKKKSDHLYSLLMDRIGRFLHLYTLKVKMPEKSIDNLKRSFEEGRKMRNRFMPIIFALVVKLATIIPIALAFLAMKAGKALILGKLALALISVIGLKGFANKEPTSTYEVVSHPTYSHSNTHDSGWSATHYKRSIDDDSDSQQIAYRAYADMNNDGA